MLFRIDQFLVLPQVPRLLLSVDEHWVEASNLEGPWIRTKPVLIDTDRDLAVLFEVSAGRDALEVIVKMVELGEYDEIVVLEIAALAGQRVDIPADSSVCSIWQGPMN
ncbi:hypothetical protein Htur_4923 (plasmid) [Haloterrigena turkmenica DSM 5511]|uniref:Uncharacterized protein n=1 Tax=Haloterrigena turkmenica (strain ATCC 51198 / DSM 5511 / JCM 9101 / NCIMB 13204 / VKM B-1734 / 4k) TaxID=543526 RepID=D2S2R3_HALTV|nr:hypothetical protein [Haloterrigena turkmenica]ADB63660.1 hypothetical protein Htur_4923 [Haloterrigena turkmenica DSM 5511]